MFEKEKFGLGLASMAMVLGSCALAGEEVEQMDPLGENVDLNHRLTEFEISQNLTISELLANIEYPEAAELGLLKTDIFETPHATYTFASFGENGFDYSLEDLIQQILYLEKVAETSIEEDMLIIEDGETENIKFDIEPNHLNNRYILFVSEEIGFPRRITPDGLNKDTPYGVTVKYLEQNSAVSIIRRPADKVVFTELCQAITNVNPSEVSDEYIRAMGQETFCNSWGSEAASSRFGQEYELVLNPPEPVDTPKYNAGSIFYHSIEQDLYEQIP